MITFRSQTDQGVLDFIPKPFTVERLANAFLPQAMMKYMRDGAYQEIKIGVSRA